MIEGAAIHDLRSAVSSSNWFHMYMIFTVILYVFLYNLQLFVYCTIMLNLYGNEVDNKILLNLEKKVGINKIVNPLFWKNYDPHHRYTLPPEQARIVLKSVFLNKINTLSVVILWLPTFWISPYFSFQKFMTPSIFGSPLPKKIIAPKSAPNKNQTLFSLGPSIVVNCISRPVQRLKLTYDLQGSHHWIQTYS